jgi:hypothetical protein
MPPPKYMFVRSVLPVHSSNSLLAPYSPLRVGKDSMKVLSISSPMAFSIEATVTGSSNPLRLIFVDRNGSSEIASSDDDVTPGNGSEIDNQTIDVVPFICVFSSAHSLNAPLSISLRPVLS